MLLAAPAIVGGTWSSSVASVVIVVLPLLLPVLAVGLAPVVPCPGAGAGAGFPSRTGTDSGVGSPLVRVSWLAIPRHHHTRPGPCCAGPRRPRRRFVVLSSLPPLWPSFACPLLLFVSRSWPCCCRSLVVVFRPHCCSAAVVGILLLSFRGPSHWLRSHSCLRLRPIIVGSQLVLSCCRPSLLGTVGPVGLCAVVTLLTL